MTRTTWTPEQIAALQARYATERTADLAAELGIAIRLVHAKANRIGLRKSAEFLATALLGRLLRGGKMSVETQFKPGQKPWNTGRKGWQAGGRSAETRFTTGMLPPNTQPLGSYRVIVSKQGHQHLEQKMSNTPGPNHKRWVPVSRLVWEAANGPVPKKHIVVFRPGMRTIKVEEITLDRLECITMGENAKRNHPLNKSPELAKLYQLKGAITRQVNRLKKESDQNHD